MAVLYLLAGTAVLLGHLSALPGAVAEMFRLAFSPAAAAGGAAGTMTASALNAARWGIARGCFSHEAGMGSAAIPAASAATDSPARQGYVNMTGVFFDTTVICTVTGLCICASGVLGTADASGAQVNGVALTALAFKTVLGPLGGCWSPWGSCCSPSPPSWDGSSAGKRPLHFSSAAGPSLSIEFSSPWRPFWAPLRAWRWYGISPTSSTP